MAISDRQFELVEARLSVLERDQAVMQNAFENTNVRLGKIETILSRLTWLMVTGIGGALIAFIISGGLIRVPIPGV